MRKRIAALVALVVGTGVLAVSPANAATSTYTYNVFKIDTDYTNVVASRKASDALVNTFTVYSLEVANVALADTPAKGTLTLTGPDKGDWDRCKFDFENSDNVNSCADGDNDGSGAFHETYMGGGVYNLELIAHNNFAGDVYADAISVQLKPNAPVGVYTAELKFGAVSSKITYTVVPNIGLSSPYIALKGSAQPTAGPASFTPIRVKADSFGYGQSIVAVSGSGASFSDECGTSLQSSQPFTEMVMSGGSTCGNSNDLFVVNTPYSGNVTLSLFGPDDSGNGFDKSAAYMSLTFTVAGSRPQPADAAATTATNLSKAQADLAAVTATVTALQTAVASLIASTAATLTTLTAQINKIMRKLGIK